ncbi:MAG: hypothetical protein ACPL2N_01690 [Candidatus Cryosericum sp.]
MTPSVSEDRGRRFLVAALVIGLIVAGWVMVDVATHGSLGLGPVLAPGTTLEVPGGSASRISVTGDRLEIVLQSSHGANTAQVVVGSDGFRRDARAPAGTFGLRLDTGAALQNGTRRLTLILPENGTLSLTVVGGGRVTMDRVRLGQLHVTGVSSSLDLDAGTPGSSVDLLQIESATGGLSSEHLGSLNMTQLVIDSIVGHYDLDLSGTVDRPCEVTVRSVVGSGVLRFSGGIGAQVVVKSIVGSVAAAGFVDEGGRSYLNKAARTEGAPRLVVRIESAVGQIQLMEVQQ